MNSLARFISSMFSVGPYLSFLSLVFKAEREQMHVGGLLAMHGARVYGLRQELVDAVGGLVVYGRMTLFQRPLELLGHFVLWKRYSSTRLARHGGLPLTS